MAIRILNRILLLVFNFLVIDFFTNILLLLKGFFCLDIAWGRFPLWDIRQILFEPPCMMIINLHVIVIRVGDHRCGAILQNSYVWISNPPDRTIGNKSKDNSELTMKEQYLLYKWNWSDTNLLQIYFEIDMTCDM